MPYTESRLQSTVLAATIAQRPGSTMVAIMEWLLWLSLYAIWGCVVYRIGRFVYNFARLAYIYWLAPRLGIGFDFKRYTDKWTGNIPCQTGFLRSSCSAALLVVTGPTDGIGKEYLYQLAKKGLKKFLLISRDNRKLQETNEWLLSCKGAQNANHNEISRRLWF